MDLEFKYTNDTDVESTVKWNGHEMEILGDFGEIVFSNELGGAEQEQVFKAKKVTFKSRPEHSIDDDEPEMELLIHHLSSDGSPAIVSFMFDVDNSMDMEAAH